MESGNSVMSVSEVHSVVSNHANAWSKNTGNSILSVLSDNGVVTVTARKKEGCRSSLLDYIRLLKITNLGFDRFDRSKFLVLMG